MFGRRCTLCGGKLDSHNICTECGLDNNKSEKNYRINQSNCDDLPLTHVHRETYQEPRREEPRRTVQKSSAEKQRQTTSQGTFGQPRPQQQMYTGQKKKKRLHDMCGGSDRGGGDPCPCRASGGWSV